MRYLLSIAVLAGMLAAAFLWRGEPADSPRRQHAPPDGEFAVDPEEQRLASGGESTSPVFLRPPAGSPESAPAPSSPIPGPGPRSDAASITETVWQLKRDAELWRMSDYLALREDPAADPAAYYTAYQFLRSCKGRPRSAEEFAEQISRFERQHEQDPERFGSQQLADALEFLEQGFDRCAGLDMDLDVAAYEALEMAGDLGFIPAQLEYLDTAGNMLMHDAAWLFGHPEYVLRYRARIEAYVATALGLRIPEAYLAYARHLFNGITAPSDPVSAYAFADLASRGIHPAQAEAESARRWFGSKLDETERAAARALAEELCERYCR